MKDVILALDYAGALWAEDMAKISGAARLHMKVAPNDSMEGYVKFCEEPIGMQDWFADNKDRQYQFVDINMLNSVMQLSLSKYKTITIVEPIDPEMAPLSALKSDKTLADLQEQYHRMAIDPKPQNRLLERQNAFAYIVLNLLQTGKLVNIIAYELNTYAVLTNHFRCLDRKLQVLFLSPDVAAELRALPPTDGTVPINVDRHANSNIATCEHLGITEEHIDSVEVSGFKDIFSNLNQMRDATFKVATDTHRYDSKPGIADVLMHTIGEATEAHTALAANKHAKQEDLDLLLQQLEQGKDDMFKKLFKLTVKSTFEDELADLLLMVLSMAGYYGVDLSTHVAMKCKYNSLRDEHSDVSDYSNNH